MLRPYVLSSSLISLMLGVSACSTVGTAASGVGTAINSLGSIVTPYKIEIIQGNVLTNEQVSALQKGFSKEQVRGILGSPLITSAFHADRWDYVFTIQRKGIAAQERRFTLNFKGDTLESFSGDTMPSENDFVATLVTTRAIGKVPELVATDAQLKQFASAGPAAPKPASTASAAVRTDYPPLEAAPR